MAEADLFARLSTPGPCPRDGIGFFRAFWCDLARRNWSRAARSDMSNPGENAPILNFREERQRLDHSAGAIRNLGVARIPIEARHGIDNARLAQQQTARPVIDTPELQARQPLRVPTPSPARTVPRHRAARNRLHRPREGDGLNSPAAQPSPAHPSRAAQLLNATGINLKNRPFRRRRRRRPVGSAMIDASRGAGADVHTSAMDRLIPDDAAGSFHSSCTAGTVRTSVS